MNYSRKLSSSNIRQLLQDRMEKSNPRREQTAEETKRLHKLEGIADKLKRGKKCAKPSATNVANSRVVRVVLFATATTAKLLILKKCSRKGRDIDE